jgi:hypothetical protein
MMRIHQLKNYNETLEKHINERDELLKKANNLIKEASQALGYKKAEGISDAFNKRFDEANGKKTYWWAGLAIIFIGAAIWLGYDFIGVIKNNADNNNLSFNLVLARISIMIMPIAGAWFCAGQYVKIKNIAEDYGYKATLVKSIIGFSEQLKNSDEKDDSYQKYITKMLNEIHQHPLKNHKKQEYKNVNIPILSKIYSLLKQFKKDSIT